MRGLRAKSAPTVAPHLGPGALLRSRRGSQSTPGPEKFAQSCLGPPERCGGRRVQRMQACGERQGSLCRTGRTDAGRVQTRAKGAKRARWRPQQACARCSNTGRPWCAPQRAAGCAARAQRPKPRCGAADASGWWKQALQPVALHTRALARRLAAGCSRGQNGRGIRIHDGNSQLKHHGSSVKQPGSARLAEISNWIGENRKPGRLWTLRLALCLNFALRCIFCASFALQPAACSEFGPD